MTAAGTGAPYSGIDIDAGGAFRGLLTRLDAIQLTVNHRQRHQWERHALDALRFGDPAEAIDAFDRAGRITVCGSAAATADQVVADWWDPVKSAGLPRIRSHDLRHTHATLLLKANVSAKVVSERLGHASVGFTLDTYAHVVPGMQAEAAARFSAAVFGPEFGVS